MEFRSLLNKVSWRPWGCGVLLRPWNCVEFPWLVRGAGLSVDSSQSYSLVLDNHISYEIGAWNISAIEWILGINYSACVKIKQRMSWMHIFQTFFSTSKFLQISKWTLIVILITIDEIIIFFKFIKFLITFIEYFSSIFFYIFEIIIKICLLLFGPIW